MESIRKLIQIPATFLTNSYFLFPQTKNIYQGPLRAIFSPGINRYSCPASTTYSPIGEIQQVLNGKNFLEMM
jgi:ferredoxin-type protein NapH